MCYKVCRCGTGAKPLHNSAEVLTSTTKSKSQPPCQITRQYDGLTTSLDYDESRLSFRGLGSRIGAGCRLGKCACRQNKAIENLELVNL